MEQQYPRRNLTHWLDEQLGDQRIRRVLCLFSGTANQALAFKRRGVQVHAWDSRLAPRRWAKALVENNRRMVPPELSNSWLHLIKDPRVAKRFSPWAGQYFTPEETIWLGIWRTHLDAAEEPYRSLGELAVLWTMHYWRSLNDQSFEYKPLIPVAAFRHYLSVVNGLVFDNHGENRALEEPFSGADYDLLFCYLPSAPRPIESLWEGWLKGDPEYEGEVTPSIEGLLLQAEEIPTWAIAFNDHWVDREAFARTLSGMRPIIGQKEIALPYPSASGSGIIRETFLLTARGGR